MAHLLLVLPALLSGTLGQFAEDPAGAPPLALARHAEELASRARAMGPTTDAGQAQARDACRWCVYSVASVLADPDPTEEESDAVLRAVEACDAVAPDAVLLDAVPLHRQSTDDLCAIASARMLLGFWGRRVSEDELIRLAGTQCLTEGVHVSFLLDCLPRYSVSALACEGSPALLRVCLAAGLPAAVYQWVAEDRSVKHMRVVIGYDRTDPEVAYWRFLEPTPELPEVWDATDEQFDALWALRWDADGHERWMCIPYHAAPAPAAPM